jgi:hypothetical protein
VDRARTSLKIAIFFMALLQACGGSLDRPNSPARLVHPRSAAVRVEPNPHLLGQVSIPWHRAQVFDHGRAVRIFFFGGARRCGGLNRVKVLGRRNTVTVTLYEGHDPGANYCPVTKALEKKVDIRLRTPLRHRRLVDGAA